MRIGRRVGGSQWPRPRRVKQTRRGYPIFMYRRSPAQRTVDLTPTEDMTARKWKTRQRGPGSETTTRRRRTQTTNIRVGSDSNSKSIFVKRPLRMRSFKSKYFNASPMVTRKTETVNTVKWNYGRQGLMYYMTNNISDLNAIKTTIASTDPTIDLMLLNTTIRYTLSNMSKAAAKVRIYEGCYMRPSNADPNILWTNGLVDLGTTQVIDSIAADPRTSRSFNTFCHITRVYDLFLPQGRTHEHIVKYGYNRVYKAEIGNIGGTINMPKWTRFTMIVGYGEPIVESDADGASVSTASGKLAIVTTRTDRYKYALPQIRYAYYTKTIPTTGLASQLLLDEGSGEAETQVIVGA